MLFPREVDYPIGFKMGGCHGLTNPGKSRVWASGLLDK